MLVSLPDVEIDSGSCPSTNHQRRDSGSSLQRRSISPSPQLQRRSISPSLHLQRQSTSPSPQPQRRSISPSPRQRRSTSPPPHLQRRSYGSCGSSAASPETDEFESLERRLTTGTKTSYLENINYLCAQIQPNFPVIWVENHCFFISIRQMYMFLHLIQNENVLKSIFFRIQSFK